MKSVWNDWRLFHFISAHKCDAQIDLALYAQLFSLLDFHRQIEQPEQHPVPWQKLERSQHAGQWSFP